MKKFLVQEVRVHRRCWPLGATGDAVEIACPLCVIEHGGKQLTASYSSMGYILCSQCERFSAIKLNGVSVIPLTVESISDRLLALEVDTLRAALSGLGNLMEMVCIDDEKPVVEVRYALDRIVLATSEALGNGAALGTTPGGAVVGEDELVSMPPSVRRLLEHGTSLPVAMSGRR